MRKSSVPSVPDFTRSKKARKNLFLKRGGEYDPWKGNPCPTKTSWTQIKRITLRNKELNCFLLIRFSLDKRTVLSHETFENPWSARLLENNTILVLFWNVLYEKPWAAPLVFAKLRKGPPIIIILGYANMSDICRLFRLCVMVYTASFLRGSRFLSKRNRYSIWGLVGCLHA